MVAFSDRSTCVYCGKLATTRDHVLPKRRGGRVTVPACVRCNHMKGDMTVPKFRAKNAERLGIGTEFEFFREDIIGIASRLAASIKGLGPKAVVNVP